MPPRRQLPARSHAPHISSNQSVLVEEISTRAQKEAFEARRRLTGSFPKHPPSLSTAGDDAVLPLVAEAADPPRTTCSQSLPFLLSYPSLQQSSSSSLASSSSVSLLQRSDDSSSALLIGEGCRRHARGPNDAPLRVSPQNGCFTAASSKQRWRCSWKGRLRSPPGLPLRPGENASPGWNE